MLSSLSYMLSPLNVCCVFGMPAATRTAGFMRWVCQGAPGFLDEVADTELNPWITPVWVDDIFVSGNHLRRSRAS